MKKLILFLFLSTSLFCFGQGKSALKDIQSIKFYGVDYSQVKIFGADESPIQFKDAFRRINELFITEAKKYNVGKQLKKEVTEISLDAVNQVNENIDLTELMTAKREYTLSKEQIKAAINALPIQKTPGVGMVFIAQFLDKSNNRGTYEVVFFNTETKEISQTDILRPLSQTFGIGRYYDDVNPEFMDAFEVALLVRQAEEQATAQAIAAAKEKAEHDRIAEIGAQQKSGQRTNTTGLRQSVRSGCAGLCPTTCRGSSWPNSTKRNTLTPLTSVRPPEACVPSFSAFRPPPATASGS